MPNEPSEAQREVDALQVRLLGADPTKQQISDYFAACLNSACGAVGAKYGHMAVFGLLMLWAETARAKIEDAAAAEQGVKH